MPDLLMCLDILFCYLDILSSWYVVIMFQKISREVKENAIALVRSGVKPKTAAKAYGISERALRRAQSNLHLFGDVEGRPRKKSGPCHSIGHDMGEVPIPLSEVVSQSVGNLSIGCFLQ
jgi:hypothetical protein